MPTLNRTERLLRRACPMVAALCLLAAPHAHAADTVTVTDLLGRTVTVPANPRRIANAFPFCVTPACRKRATPCLRTI